MTTCSAFFPIKRLVTSPASRRVPDIMEDTDVRVAPEMDQEEVARIMAATTCRPCRWWMEAGNCWARSPSTT